MVVPQKASEWSFEEVTTRVEEAAKQLREEREPILFHNHASERSISHRFAVHLERRFETWNVDCEYNRQDDDLNKYKKLFLPKNDDGTVWVFEREEGSRVSPDIVVHHRGLNDPDDNLLVIEVKLAWSQYSNKRDLKKLKAFTGRYPVKQVVFYRFGLFVKFDEEGRLIKFKGFERGYRQE